MCGIAGWASLDPGVLPTDNDKLILTAMCDKMCHRGPDSAGDWYSRGVAMQMRRLAVVDLDTGDQPVRNSDGSIVAVMNGEIYNYRDLKRSLQLKGRRFRSSGDAELIPVLYEEFGEDMLQHLNGMFALALWDARREMLFIARDRLGEKPLYYGIFDGILYFASELKALIAHPSVETRLNVSALRQYLAYDFVPSPNTIFENIYKLPAAHFLRLKSGRVEIEPYWSL
jgi:asparagine synthase (glutamine-hydrolysing)